MHFLEWKWWSHYRRQWWLVYRRIYASLGLNALTLKVNISIFTKIYREIANAILSNVIWSTKRYQYGINISRKKNYRSVFQAVSWNKTRFVSIFFIVDIMNYESAGIFGTCDTVVVNKHISINIAHKLLHNLALPLNAGTQFNSEYVFFIQNDESPYTASCQCIIS